METVYFTKEFTKGFLKGIRIIESISFPTVEDCARFAVVGREVKKPIGGSPYKIVDASFQNYSRSTSTTQGA